MGVVCWTTIQPPRRIRGFPLRHSHAIFLGGSDMIVVKEEDKRILDNLELTLIVLAAFAALAIVLVPVR